MNNRLNLWFSLYIPSYVHTPLNLEILNELFLKCNFRLYCFTDLQVLDEAA